MSGDGRPRPRVALFVTCLVDLWRPSVGWAAVRLIEAAGYRVEVPAAQTCCGQPAFNAGDRRRARILARAWVAAFAGCERIVAPSGSCAAMIRRHLPDLLPDDPGARTLAARCLELTEFLDQAGYRGGAQGVLAYHDSCSGLRELGLRDQPRRLLAGCDRRDLADGLACCGFGGAFCAKQPDLAGAIADRKLAAFRASGAPVLAGGDLGCLLHLQGRAEARGQPIAVRHVAEILAPPP